MISGGNGTRLQFRSHGRGRLVRRRETSTVIDRVDLTAWETELLILAMSRPVVPWATVEEILWPGGCLRSDYMAIHERLTYFRKYRLKPFGWTLVSAGRREGWRLVPFNATGS